MGNRLLAGRYELIEKIGEGGMAVVYKAKCRLLNRYVAIKILRPEFTRDETFIENFKRESQAAAGLSHPNIVGVYDVGKEGNIHFIVMELVEGRPLSQILEEKEKLSYKETIAIAKQVASALSLAHKNQIIHRDVKPHNILITSAGTAKLADFGIAKAVSTSTVVAGNNNKVMGSVHYLSPEQARGSYVDERTDLYSLGIVMYEMLTGKVPFDGDNPISIALMHINDQMTPPSQLTSGIPPQLEKVIMKATDKYQNNRYNTAQELLDDLDNIDFITKVMGNAAFLNMEESGIDSIAGREGELVGTIVAAPEEEPEKEATEEKSANEERKKPKNKNTGIIIGLVIAALAVIGISGFAFASILGLFGEDAKEVTIPNLEGKTIEQATLELEELGLILQEGEQVYSAEQEEGRITSQTPSAGTLVVEGKVVTVNISKGKKSGVIPNLVGKDWKEAEEYLKEFGFEIGYVEKVTSEKPKDTILTQDPEAGESALEGTKINIEISDGEGKAMTRVPNLYNLTPGQADAALAEANLVRGDVVYEESDMVEPNRVIGQTYSVGEQVEEGTKIGYVVSKAPEVIPPEDVEDEPEQGEPQEDVTKPEENEPVSNPEENKDEQVDADVDQSEESKDNADGGNE